MSKLLRLTRTLPISAILALLACSLAASPDPTPAPHYTVTDLNVHINGQDSGPHAINVKGEITGTMERLRGGHVAFLYKEGVVTELMGLDGKESLAYSLNNKGQIAGEIRLENHSRIGVVWENGQARKVGSLPDLSGSHREGAPFSLLGINDQGQVIARVSHWMEGYAAFEWQYEKNMQPQPLDTLGDFPKDKQAGGDSPGRRAFLAGPLTFLPESINASGQVVGVNQFEPSPGLWNHAMLWENGRERDLGTLAGGTLSEAKAINDRGQIVGSSTAQVTTEHSFTWVTHAFLWEEGKMQDLGLPPGGIGSKASAINNKGEVVGEIYVQGGNTRAVLWRNGQVYSLNDLLPKETDWVLEEALAINDRGQIVGLGYRTKDENRHRVGGSRAFLLTPQ